MRKKELKALLATAERKLVFNKDRIQRQQRDIKALNKIIENILNLSDQKLSKGGQEPGDDE